MAEKRIVVVTKESMFYMPENGTPIPPTRHVSKITRSFDDTDMGSPSRGGDGYAAGNKTTTFGRYYTQALYLVMACILFLALFGLLVVYSKEIAPIVAAGLGGALGYTIAHAQGMAPSTR